MIESIEEIWKEVVAANERLMKCTNAVSEARRNETEAMNTLNALQKKFDEQLLQKKKSMHRESDWNRARFGQLIAPMPLVHGNVGASNE